MQHWIVKFVPKSLQLTLNLATRYYSVNSQNRYIRFINRASRLGFSIGVAALIIGLSLMNGFERELRNTLLSAIPHIEYEAVSGQLNHWPTTVTEVSAHSDVVAAAPYVKLNAMIQRGNHMEAVRLMGVDGTLQKVISAIPNSIKEGQWLSGKASDAVIGASLAKSLQLNIGQSMELLVPHFSESGQLLAPLYLSFTIAGIYEVGGQMDSGQVFVSLQSLNEIQQKDINSAQGISVELNDPFTAFQSSRAIGQLMTDYVYVLDWFRSHGHVYNDIVLVKDIMYLVMILVMGVASFNIVSSLSMAVQDKYADIGILKTMGLTTKQIKHVFMLMGVFTAAKGIAWGMLWGTLIAWQLTEMSRAIERFFGVQALDGDVYFIDFLPSEIDAIQIAVIGLTALLIAVLASLYPATKASRLSPVELVH